MRRHRAGLVVLGLVAALMVVRHPSANIEVLTHDTADRAPHRVQAAFDLGLASVSVLVTWTAGRLVTH